MWWRRTGAPWRDLPDEFGPRKTVFNRFDRWSKTGRWSALFAALATDIDGEWQSIHDFRTVLVAMNCDPVIPSSSSWINPPSYDKDLYKGARRGRMHVQSAQAGTAVRDPLREDLRNYAAVVAIGSALLWLRI